MPNAPEDIEQYSVMIQKSTLMNPESTANTHLLIQIDKYNTSAWTDKLLALDPTNVSVIHTHTGDAIFITYKPPSKCPESFTKISIQSSSKGSSATTKLYPQ